MNKFYFNSGVKPWNSGPLRKYESWINGEKHHSFEADAPADAELLFLCPYPDLPEGKHTNVIVRKTFNTDMSEYAYFRISQP